MHISTLRGKKYQEVKGDDIIRIGDYVEHRKDYFNKITEDELYVLFIGKRVDQLGPVLYSKNEKRKVFRKRVDIDMNINTLIGLGYKEIRGDELVEAGDYFDLGSGYYTMISSGSALIGMKVDDLPPHIYPDVNKRRIFRKSI